MNAFFVANHVQVRIATTIIKKQIYLKTARMTDYLICVIIGIALGWVLFKWTLKKAIEEKSDEKYDSFIKNIQEAYEKRLGDDK